MTTDELEGRLTPILMEAAESGFCYAVVILKRESGGWVQRIGTTNLATVSTDQIIEAVWDQIPNLQ